VFEAIKFAVEQYVEEVKFSLFGRDDR